jgi:transposase
LAAYAKAAVEAGVRFAQSYILGRLRNVTFFSLAECQAAIVVALERMNGREMRRLGVSRRQLFETIERPAMQSLPEQDYEYAEWRFARVGIDYHVEAEGFFYSVPHALLREQVDTRITTRTIEIFHRGKRVASHARRYSGPRHGTLPDHMPSAHRRYAEWSAERFARQARDIGPETEALILAVLARRPHPEQGFRTCLGVLRLFRGLDAVRVEAISRRAVEVGVLTYASVASIIKHRLDQSVSPQAADGAPLLHENIRGSGYFH